MAGQYADLADLIDKNEAVALDKIKHESDMKQKGSRDSMDRRDGREQRGSPKDESRHSERGRLSQPPSSSQPRYIDERAENDERRLRRSKGVSDDGVNSDKESANGSVRDRRHRRSQSPPKGGRRDYRDREYHSRGEPLRDSYRPGGDRRGDRRGDDDSYRPDSDRRRRPDDRDSDRRRRDRSPDGGDSRGEREPRDRRSGARDNRHRSTPTPPTEDDRDERTVFVQQIAASCSSNRLQRFFEQIGPVVEAQIVKDRVSGRSKGVGYVEFRQKESVEKALGLTGQKINGVPIIVQQTEAEKNRQPRNPVGGQTPANGAPFHRLYVGNIHFSVTEDDLRSIFGPFGELEFVQIQKEDATGRSRGYGFVQFSDPGHAKQALEKLNGFELAKRPIRVGLGNDRFTADSTKSLLQASSQQFQGSEFSGSGGRGAYAGGSGNFDRAARDADKTGAGSALDDSDVGGVNMSNYNRNDLMRKLARTDKEDTKTVAQPIAKKPIDQPQTATRCVVLRHMYNPATLSDPAEQKELEEDVRDECNSSYGEVVHIGLNLDNNDGEVYVKFRDLKGSKNAIQGLNGRYFGGSQITASYIVDAIYNTNFPKAATV